MRIFFLMFFASLSFSASAQDGIETDLDAEMTLVGAFMDESTGRSPRNGMGEISVSGSASKVLANGVEISGNVTFRGQTDHPQRPGFAGSVIDCPPNLSGCANLNGSALRGSFSRLSTQPFADDAGARGSLERAYVEIDGGWGALTLGRDDGVGARFFEGGPTVFSLARDRDPILDPTGINSVRTRNDISSTAEKASYVTPRLLGLRAGLSYTPDASVRRLDLETSRKALGVIEPELGDAVELGLQGYHFFRDVDLRLRGSLTWSQANSATPMYEDTQTTSFGLDLERRDKFRVGFSILNSSNGGYGDYSSAAIGAEYIIKDWRIGLNGSQATDDTIGLETESATLGLGRDLNDHVGLTLGYRTSRAELDSAPAGWSDNIDQDGVLLEVRIRK